MEWENGLSWEGIEELGLISAILGVFARARSCVVVGLDNSLGIGERRVRLRDADNIGDLERERESISKTRGKSYGKSKKKEAKMIQAEMIDTSR